MGDNITQAERLLSTIMAARSRVRGLASGLPFDAASRIEARSTVGSSPVRQDMEVVHEMLETRVRAWRRQARRACRLAHQLEIERMVNSIFDEYFDKLRTLPCFTKLDGHEAKTSLL